MHARHPLTSALVSEATPDTPLACGDRTGALFFYFAYGSTMNARHMAYRCPSAEAVGAASLAGYRLVERAYADIEQDPMGVVWGVLWRVLVRDLDRLDTYEACPSFYRRMQVAVVVHDPDYGPSPAVHAWTYEMTPQCKVMRTGDAWDDVYRQACAEGARDHGLPVNAFDPAAAGIANGDIQNGRSQLRTP